MGGQTPEHSIERPVVHMRWEHVSFVHWSYDPAVVEPLLPPGLALDMWDGRAWVGLVPFVMAGVRPPFVPPLPGLSTFPEFNVRTYVRDGEGRDGLLFLTLEAAQPLALLARPAVGIGYTLATMRVSRRGGDVGYASRRTWPRNPQARVRMVVTVGDELPLDQQSDFDVWLTGRWRAFSHRWGQLFSTPVEHEPWPLHRATVAPADSRLVRACGLPAPAGDPVVHYAPAVNVRLGAPNRVAGQAPAAS